MCIHYDIRHLAVFGLLFAGSGPAAGWTSLPRQLEHSVRLKGLPLWSISEQKEDTYTFSERVPEDTSSEIISTSALLNITYDGGRFTGWSSSNADSNENSTAPTMPLHAAKRSRRKRKRMGFVRGAEGVFKKHLAKLYGDVDPDRIQIEACSRVDKGVHAESMIAQFYCLSKKAFESIQKRTNSTNGNGTMMPISSIPGKRIPHPTSSIDDSYFEPLPFDLAKMQYCLNRMLPDDIRVRNMSPSPTKTSGLPFHPTLDSTTKTYQYTFSVGPIHNPLQWRYAWNLDGVTNFNLDQMRQAAELFEGTKDFIAFRGAPRGSDDKRRQEVENTTCTITRVDIDQVQDDFSLFEDLTTTYTVTITGDRFLYKMVRFIVGSLVGVGTGKLAVEDIRQALEKGSWDSMNGNDRKHFTCAPPHGLVLHDVSFGDDIQLEWIT